MLGDILLKQVAQSGGMPRWQVRSILYSLVDRDITLCGGVSCAQMIDITRPDIEKFLDDLHIATEKDERLTGDSLLTARQTLLKSLAPDFERPKVGAPTDVVRFQSPAIDAAVALARRNGGNFTYRDLKSITALHVRAEWDGPLNLNDLTLFPNLKRLAIAVWKPEHLAQVLPFAHLVDDIEFFRPMSGTAPELRIAHLKDFGNFTHLKTVSLAGMRIHQPDLLPQTFPYVRSLSVTNVHRIPENINNGLLIALSKMPYLRKLNLDVATTANLQDWAREMPKTLRDVRISIGSQSESIHCGTLEIFKIFRHASSMTIAGCPLTGLGPFQTEFAWQHLKLDNPTKAGDARSPLVIKLPPQLPHLLTFQSSTQMVTLDNTSQHELAVRLAGAATPPVD